MITIHCPCGEVFHADEQHAGRAIKCWKCERTLSIGAPPPARRPDARPAEAHPFRRRVGSRRSSALRPSIVVLAFSLTALGLFLVLSPRGRDTRQPSTQVSTPHAPSVVVPQPLPTPAPVPTPTGPPFRLRTGTNIGRASGLSGRGTLRINNGTSYDAAVTLLDAEVETPRRFVYIRARGDITLRNIGPCRCRLFFALGTDWNEAAEEFRENTVFWVFDDMLEFTEVQTEARVHWATFSVTLHAVPEGKARTARLSKEEFERLLGKHRGGRSDKTPNPSLQRSGSAGRSAPALGRSPTQ